MISMQKSNINGSILIWSIFLSLVMSIGFISISTKIHKNIQNNIEFQNNITKNISSTWTVLFNNESIVEENKNSIIFGMKKSENKIISFSWSSQDFITLWILNWWPVELKYNNNSILIDEQYSFSWNVSNIDINIENLSWYSLLEITSSAEIIKDNNGIIIWKKIWNKNLIKQYPQ